MKMDDFKYGMPRTSQTDMVVGHSDSADHPSHFIAVNLHGQVYVIELSAGDANNAHIYSVTAVSDDTAPVVVSFRDSKEDGKPDMVVSIGDANPYTVVLYNNGKTFQASH